MNNLIEIMLPDIGGHTDVEVIDVMIKPGDTLTIDQPMMTLETDKATMEVPSTLEGVVKSVNIKIGSRVSRGDIIAIVDVNSQKEEPVAQHEPSPTVPTPVPHSTTYHGEVNLHCDVLVLGGGPAGYSAAFRAADLGQKTLLIERYPTLGGVCLNVGCIPSKALLHQAFLIDEVKHLALRGITFSQPEIDVNALRDYKKSVIHKLTSGLASMAKSRQVDIVRGIGSFLDTNHMIVHTTQGQSPTEKKTIIKFNSVIIAAGSSVLKLPFIPDDPRIVDSTGALELPFIPKKMLIIGGGIIGLEMGTVYSSLGARLDVVEMASGLMQGADRDLVKVWLTHNKYRFDHIMLNTKTVHIDPKKEGVWVKFEGEQAIEPQCYDLVLYATGRVPNGKTINAENAGVFVDDKGFILVDKQQRTNVPHIYAVGDIIGQPMLAHKGVHEGHIAAENAANHKAYFDARIIPNVAYTDPEIAWVGLTEEQARQENILITKSIFPWAASGRAIANGRDEGFTKLIFDKDSEKILGGAIVGTHAGDMIGEICLAIEMGADMLDIGKTIHPHPTLGESIGLAAEVASGTCTDLPAQKKR